MNKIEEMANEIQKSVDGCAEYWAKLIAKHLIEQGYRNVKNKVVLTKEEYERLSIFQFTTAQQIMSEARKETAREILKKGNEYLMQSTDKTCAFACFLGIIEHEYGVEVEV